MPIVKLTEDFIANNLICTSGVKTEFVSDERTGLYVEVRFATKGVGTYYLRYKDANGKTTHQKIGRTTEITLNEARNKVIQLKDELANGTDLKDPPIPKKGEMTLDQLWVEYFEFAKSTKRSYLRDRQLYVLRIAKRLGHLKLSEITVRQIQTLMMDIRKEGLSAASADHHGQLMRRLGTMAVKWGYLDVNFAKGIELYHEFNEVNNIPNDEQLQKLLSVLQTDANREICLLVQFLLMTGARRSEAVNMKFTDISLEQKIWTVPHHSSKSKRTRYIPLNDGALDVLAQIQRKPEDIYVFANPATGKPFVSVFKPWDRIRNKAGLPKCRLHDLRHTFASTAANSGCTIYEISQLLGHADTRVTQRYAHLSKSTMLNAASSVYTKLSSLMPKLLEDKSQEAA